MDNKPLSEQYRLAAIIWVDLDAAARLLEETKTAILSQWKVELGDIPDSHAERTVKASDRWVEKVGEIVESRTKANAAKCALEYIRMRHSEQQSYEATKRHEMRL